jgi:hypothetical protein
MAEIVFEVTQEADGGLVAECLSEDIFTQAGSWDELRGNVKEEVAASGRKQSSRDRAGPSAAGGLGRSIPRCRLLRPR